MPCPECLNRRDFLARAGTAAALAALAGCGDGAVSGPSIGSGAGGPPPAAFSIKVLDFPELQNVGHLVRVQDVVAVKRTGTSTFDAFDMRCTHEGCVVGITGGQQFDCPCHFSRFSNTGAVLQGPADEPLRRLATSYDTATDTLNIG